MIIAREFGQAKNENPNQGSYFMEFLTDLVEQERASLAEQDPGQFDAAALPPGHGGNLLMEIIALDADRCGDSRCLAHHLGHDLRGGRMVGHVVTIGFADYAQRIYRQVAP